jgi:hypothetical protein
VSYDRAAVADALVAVLNTADPAVTAFDHPPQTLNPPCYVVAYPSIKTYNLPAFSIDRAEQVVLCVAGLDDPATIDTLERSAVDALAADPSLGGVVQVLRLVEQRNWRTMAVAGADYLTAELACEIQM